MLIDIGANLTHPAFHTDLEAVLQRADAVGVRQLVVTGCNEQHSHDALALAQQHPGRLFSTTGVHPHEAATCNDATLATLEALASQPQVVAIGECGLDFNRDYSPRDQQEKWFEAQLELAASLQKPVFLHQRDAHERFTRILGRHRQHLVKAVAHCFTGNAEALAAYLDMDLHIGVTGWICDERRGLELRDLVPNIPLSRLMIETDAPYLLPRDLRPKPKSRRNEPMHLPHIADTITRLMQTPPQVFAEAVTATSRAFFDIPECP